MAASQLMVLTNMAELVVRQLEKDHILKLQKLVSDPMVPWYMPAAECCSLVITLSVMGHQGML